MPERRLTAAMNPLVDPVVVLAHTRFPRSAEAFVRGVNDSVYSPQQRKTDLAARHAGMTVMATVLGRSR